MGEPGRRRPPAISQASWYDDFPAAFSVDEYTDPSCRYAEPSTSGWPATRGWGRRIGAVMGPTADIDFRDGATRRYVSRDDIRILGLE